ncbi:hypothetical protein [Amycolatopsis sp. YIM 10]|uniref:hypothetical protein n=1 Tax=Amycolatopsis sp. YIM 10 TaxID=2653857 RepID=UPI0012903AEB|nr:hypothetical protein [Amycolatopsis sp. YIM 10]QFU87932.1 hypothetical protein YIM_13730 [Amycolatopsis sp. YIM 10]
MRSRSVVFGLVATLAVTAGLGALAVVAGPATESKHDVTIAMPSSAQLPDSLVPPSSPAPEPEAPLTEEMRAELASAVVAAVESAAPGTDLGLAVYDRVTRSAVAIENGDAQFYSASVVKLLIAIDLLHDAGWTADDRTKENLSQLLGASNDGVADALWAAGGRRDIVRQASALIGLVNTTPPNVSDEWEMTRLSAQDVITTYEYIHHQIPVSARDVLLAALTGPDDRAADGFDQFFGIPAALPGTTWGVKQGWMRAAGHVVLHTTGVVGERYSVALLTHQPSRLSFETASEAITAGIAALAPVLSGAEKG